MHAHVHNGGGGRWRWCLSVHDYQGLQTDWCAPLAVFRDMSTTCRRPAVADVASTQPLLTIELGVRGIGYEDVLPVGDGGGGGEEQDDDDEDADDDEDDDADESVLSVNGADGERPVADAAAVPVGWMELSLWPRWVMRLAPKVTSRPGVAAKHRETSEAQRV